MFGKKYKKLLKENEDLKKLNRLIAAESKNRIKIIEGVGAALGMRYPSENREFIVGRVKELVKKTGDGQGVNE